MRRARSPLRVAATDRIRARAGSFSVHRVGAIGGPPPAARARQRTVRTRYRFSRAIESTMKTSALRRFLKYVTYDTRSDEASSTFPSTSGQLVLLRELVEELRALGLADAAMDDYGYVMATVAPTVGRDQAPVIGFIAHVDTSPEMPGQGVRPLIHERYDGRDLALPDDPSVVLRASENPALAAQSGNTIVTASGLTLLGSDDKAGVAEIV